MMLSRSMSRKCLQEDLMEVKTVNRYTIEEAIELFSQNVDTIIIVDHAKDRYYAVKRTGFFRDFIDKEGDYRELVESLCFHFNNTQEKIIQDYKVFIPTFGKFKGKYSKKLKLFFEGELQPHVVQITVYLCIVFLIYEAMFCFS